MSLLQAASFPRTWAISEPGSRDQYNVLLWTSLASRILGLPSPAQPA